MGWRRRAGVGWVVLLVAGCGQPASIIEEGVRVPAEGQARSALEWVSLFPASEGADVQHLVEGAQGEIFVAGVFRGDLAREIAGDEGHNRGRCPNGGDGSASASDDEPFAARVTADGRAWGRAFGGKDGCAGTLRIGLDGDEVVVGAEGRVTFAGVTHEGSHALRLDAQTGADRRHERFGVDGARWTLRTTASEVFLERNAGTTFSLSLGTLQSGVIGESADGGAVVAGSGRAVSAELNALSVWRVAPDGTTLWQRAFDFLSGAKSAEAGFVSVEAVLAEPDGGAVVLARFAGTLQLDVFVHGWHPEAWTESWRYLVIRIEPDGLVRWTREGAHGVLGNAMLARAGNGGLVLWGVALSDGGVRAQRSSPTAMTWLEDEYGETVRSRVLGVRVSTLRPAMDGGLLLGGSTTTAEGLGVEGDVAAGTGVVARLPPVLVVPRR